MHKQLSLAVLAGLSIACGDAQAQSASQALDGSWTTICASAVPGTAFYERCQEILNAGPGSADRRSAAALGNNLEIFAAQARLMVAMSKARARAAGRAADKANQGSGNGFLSDGLSEEPGSIAMGSRWAVFTSFSHSNSDRSETAFERGYDDSGQSWLLGVDYRFNANWTGLLAFQRESRDIEFLRGTGRMDSDTDQFSAAIAYTGGNGFSASLSANSGQMDSRLRREIGYTLVLDRGLPTERQVTIISRGDSRNDADVRGVDLDLGWERGAGAWSLRYGGNLSWQKTDIGRIAENNDRGLDFLVFEQEVTSLQAGVSFEAARTFSTPSGVWQPYFRARWLHEFEDDPRRIFTAFRAGDSGFRISYMTGEPDRSFGNVGLGIVGVFTGGWQAYLGWERSVGHSEREENRFDLGWRMEF